MTKSDGRKLRTACGMSLGFEAVLDAEAGAVGVGLVLQQRGVAAAERGEPGAQAVGVDHGGEHRGGRLGRRRPVVELAGHGRRLPLRPVALPDLAVPLAPLTTLRLGGPARRLVEAESADEVVTALREPTSRFGDRVAGRTS